MRNITGFTDTDTSYSGTHKNPYHAEGVVLDTPPSGVEEGIEASGLGWQVHKAPLHVERPAVNGVPENGLYVPNLESSLLPVNDFRANVREDTNTVLGVVGKDYTVVQNRDAFEWLESLLGEELVWECAGSFKGGRRVWVMARLPEGVEIGGDETQSFVFAANSHDGSLAVTAAATNLRIVCMNTLNYALKDAERTYKFRHVGNLQAKLDEGRQVLGTVRDWTKALAELGDDLAREPLSIDQFDNRVVKPLVGLDTDEELTKRTRTNRENARDSIIDIFNGAGPAGDTSGNSPGTKWCAANAIVEYSDWGRRKAEATSQVSRSVEDTALKDRGLRMVIAA